MDKEQEERELKKLHEYSDAFNTGYNLEKLSKDQAVSEKDKRLLRNVSNSLRDNDVSGDFMEAFNDGRKQYEKDKEREKMKNQLKAKRRDRKNDINRNGN